MPDHHDPAAHADANATDKTVWQTAALTKNYLDGVRGAIPLAAEQLAIMRHLILMTERPVTRFLDLGCGDGILGQMVLDEFPAATGVLLDFSAPMLEAARQRLLNHTDNITIVQNDYGDPGWLATIQGDGPFDVIVSGFSIHHQADGRKQTLYRELYDLLTPGGIFLNLEHVKSATPWVSHCFDEMFIDALYAYHQQTGGTDTRAQVATTFYNRPDKAANILAPVEVQCNWLRDIGFTDVDCFFKIFELALFGGIKPAK
ncbi:class I SAM-dependent methyltransferase [Chloroflexota bacterium]